MSEVHLFEKCSDVQCSRPGRMALRTTRPSREDLRTTIFYDDRVAPKSAQTYCREHGTELLVSLVDTLVPEDEEVGPLDLALQPVKQ